MISHLNFAAFSGTESYVLTVAQQLERLGHEATIYAVETGPMAAFARQQGVRVVDDPSKLPSQCDAVFAQDASTAYQLAARYPQAIRICAMHSAHNPMQSAPQLEDVCQTVVVLNDRLRRRAEHLAWRGEVVRLRQPIDLKRFNIASAADEPRERPRVLALSNYANRERLRMIEAACGHAGVELVHVGAPGRSTPNPEHAIAGAEIVISLGRGAIEGMAGGRAVYVFGPSGSDGWVTPENYAALESDGFSGRATDAAIDTARLAADLADWQDGMGETNRDLVWAHHDGERHAIELVELIHRLGGSTPRPIQQADELARLVRLEWYSFARAEAAIAECRRIRAEADALREEDRAAASELERAYRDLELRLQTLLGTRRYRLACQIARPLDRIRARWSR